MAAGLRSTCYADACLLRLHMNASICGSPIVIFMLIQYASGENSYCLDSKLVCQPIVMLLG